MCEIINSGIQPLQNLIVTVQLVEQLKAIDDQKKQWIQYWITKSYKSLNALVEKHGVQYSFRDQITLADCCLAPQMFSSARFGVDLNPFPKLVTINELLMTQEAFVKASPSEQPDAQ